MANVQRYSKEEVERKRLEALERRKQTQSKLSSNNSVVHSVPGSKCITSDVTTPKFKLKSNSSSMGPIRSYKTGNRYTPMVPVTSKTPKQFFGTNSVITAKFYMITNERFAVETSSYLSTIVEIFKTVKSKSYDAKTKIWSFHLTDYDDLIKKLLELKSNLSLSQIPSSVIYFFKKNYYSTDKEISFLNLLPIDETLKNILMPFQQEGICYGISKKGRCIIADDMGLGKTIQALGIACYFKESWPLLIVAPSSVRYQWSEAIYDYLPSIPAHYIQQFTNTKDIIDDVKIVIVSYDLLAKSEDMFKSRGFQFVILDESHIIKNNKTNRFKAIKNIIVNSRHIILLSGTPALSRPMELFTQVNLVIPNFMAYHEFGIRYCAGEKKPFGWDFSGSSNMQELQLLLKSTCMIRRLKADVLNQLPSKIRQIIILDPDIIKRDKIEQKFNSLSSNDLTDHKKLLQYYNLSSFIRQRAVGNYVTQLFSSKRKCLIFAHHQHMLDTICDIAKSMKIEYIRIDGRASSTKRKDSINDFQNNKNCLAAILSITAANAGITLTAAHLVVFAELFWNPGILCQAEDRVHRIGQNDSVLIQYLVARGTADDHLWSLLKRKINTLSEVGLNQNNVMDEAEIKNQIINDHDQLKMDKFLKIPRSIGLEGNCEMDMSNENMNVNKSLEINEREEKDETSINNIKELLSSNDEDWQIDDDWNV